MVLRLPAYSGGTDAASVLTEIYRNRCIELFMSGLKLEDSRRFARPATERNRTGILTQPTNARIIQAHQRIRQTNFCRIKSKCQNQEFLPVLAFFFSRIQGKSNVILFSWLFDKRLLFENSGPDNCQNHY